MAKGNKTGKGGFGDNPQNINRNGAPKRGESWAEIIKRIGNMTPAEAAEHAKKTAAKLKQYGGDITLKEAVVIRGYAALLFEPTSSLMNVYMDREDGKVQEKLDLTSKGEQIGISDEEKLARLAVLARKANARTG